MGYLMKNKLLFLVLTILTMMLVISASCVLQGPTPTHTPTPAPSPKPAPLPTPKPSPPPSPTPIPPDPEPPLTLPPVPAPDIIPDDYLTPSPRDIPIIKPTMTNPTISVESYSNPHPRDEARFGYSISAIGDLDGDNIGELIVGAWGDDRVYILSERRVLGTIVDPDGLRGYRFGYSVCVIGDINGDGIDDFAVGAPWRLSYEGVIVPDPSDIIDDVFDGDGEENNQDDEIAYWAQYGRVFLFSGWGGGLIRKIETTYGSNFGIAVCPLGDINGDDVPDIAVGEPRIVSSHNSGVVEAISGNDGSVIWPTFEPPQVLGSFGSRIVDVGDLTGDGYKDLLVGAQYSRPQWLFWPLRHQNGVYS